MATKSDQPPIIAVVGETASGKSTLALEIAERYNGELICADSRTIYKGMDIGTAKPSKEEQARVRHHLLNVVRPGEAFTAADFKRLALAAIADISSRGKLPIIVGGTGLYVDAIIFDYQFAPPAAPAERAKLEGMEIEELRHLIETKGLLPPQNEKNKRHLVRTLERGAELHQDRQEMRPHTLLIGLQLSRNNLRRRIEERVEQMFRKGLRKEVEELHNLYNWDSEALTGIGYREFQPFYDGKSSMSEVKRKIVQSTLHLAKRQRTWFKRNPRIHWIDEPTQAWPLIDEFLK